MSYANHEYRSTPGHSNCIDPLHISLVFLRLLNALRENGSSLAEHASVIHKFCKAVEEGLETVAGMRHWWKEDYRASAKRCLELVNKFDDSESQPPVDEDREAFSTWAKNFPSTNILFTDSFVEKIALYLPGLEEDILVSHRIRRLRFLQADAASGTLV